MNEIVCTEQEMSVIAQSQTVMQTNYDNQVLVNQIAQSIALPKEGGQVNIADVLTVVRLASSMHLDPMLGGIWAYKDKHGRLVCGVSSKGWKQALHSQPSYCGVSFLHEGELTQKKITTRDGQFVLTYYPITICIIKKKLVDGSVGEFRGTAYADEEIDYSKPSWLQRPKRMLETRAMSIAASNAYGWGAYDEEELNDIKAENGVATIPSTKPKRQSGADRTLSLLKKKQEREIEVTAKIEEQDPFADENSLDTLIDQLKQVKTHEELEKVLADAPKEIVSNRKVKDLCKALEHQFELEF